ncbi:PAS domain-containing protein [Rudanella lutea]|uniref:PAS domain-containing protein n=1 Tax=Rudanella lutea TaxID=451374 RepID=UPI000364F32F|nr:PAS domain-containing protein [Rudanella lutea]
MNPANQMHALFGLDETKNQPQVELLHNLLNNSPNGIEIYKPLRDTAGVVYDFLVISMNPVARQLSGYPADGLSGYTLLRRFPQAKQTGLFDRCVQLIGTSEPFEYEHYEPERRSWYAYSASVWQDGLVLNFSDITPRKEAEIRHRELVDTLNSVLDGSINSIMTFRAMRNAEGHIEDFEILTANQAAEVYLNMPESTMIGQRLLHLFPENLSMGLFDMYVKAMETGQPQRMQALYNGDEQPLWLEESARRLGEETLLVTFMDITESRLALETVQQQANWLRVVLNGSISCLVSLEAVYDTGHQLVDFRFAVVNRAAERFLETTEAELIGKSLLKCCPWHIDTGLFDLYKRSLHEQKEHRQEVYMNQDGFERWLDVSVSPSGSNRLVIAFMNITDVRKAQHALMGESILFKALSNNVPETGVLVCDHTLRILYANGDLPPAFRVSGNGALTNQPFVEMVVPEFREKGLANFTEALSGRSQRMEEQVGDQIYEVFFAPVHNDAGQTVMAMLTFRNVTQNRLFQRQLEESVNELKRSNANLEQFAYVASHDLQEPLRKVQSFGDVLADQYREALGETGYDLVQRMQLAARRMSALIHDLLTYSRLSAQTAPFKPANLNQIVAEVIDDLEANIREKSAHIHVGSLPVVKGDASQFRQLFQNLLSNALKFTRAGVQPMINISANLHMDPSDERRLVVEVVVTDNGIGFEQQHAERIFQVFGRLHGRSEYSGTGIGLAIVQKIAQNHGGEIVAEGYPNKGATFKLLLPIN